MSLAKFTEDIWDRYFEAQFSSIHRRPSSHPVDNFPAAIRKATKPPNPPAAKPLITADDFNRDQQEKRSRSLETSYRQRMAEHRQRPCPSSLTGYETPLSVDLVVGLIRGGYGRDRLLQQLMVMTGETSSAITIFFRRKLKHISSQLSIGPAPAKKIGLGGQNQ